MKSESDSVSPVGFGRSVEKGTGLDPDRYPGLKTIQTRATETLVEIVTCSIEKVSKYPMRRPALVL